MTQSAWWQDWIAFGDAVLQSRFALAILLLLAAVGLALYVRREIVRTRHEMKAAIIQSQRDALFYATSLQSAMNMVSEFRMMLLQVFSGRREPPKELERLNERWLELRKKVHDDVHERRERMKEAIKRYEKQVGKEEGLKED